MAVSLPVRFDCTVRIAAGVVEIDVTLTNNGTSDLGVFNRIAVTRPDMTMAFSQNVAYIELENDNLLVRKMALPIPSGLAMAAYVPPYVSRIPVGSTLTESIRLALPIKVMQPFRRALVGGGQVIADRPANARSVTVAYGVFAVDGSVQLMAQNPAHLGVLTAIPPDPAIRGQQLLSQTFPLPQGVAVLDYRAVPWP